MAETANTPPAEQLTPEQQAAATAEAEKKAAIAEQEAKDQATLAQPWQTSVAENGTITRHIGGEMPKAKKSDGDKG